MIIYEVRNVKLGTHRYVAQLVNQAEVDVYNKQGIGALLAGTNIPVNMIGTVLVDEFENPQTSIDAIYVRAKPYVVEVPGEVIAQVITHTWEKNTPKVLPKVKKIAAPSVDTRTTENIRDNLEKQYREFILLLHRSEMELSSIRRTMEEALHKIQDQKILEKFHK